MTEDEFVSENHTGKVRILGISAYYHDSAACLVEDGVIVAAAQEERFTRIKGDSSFPHNAVGFCLEAGGITEKEVDYVVFYENPYAKFDRLLTTYHATVPASLPSYLRSLPVWLTQKLWMRKQIAEELGVKKHVYFCDHHLSHAASAFFPSPFEEAAVLTIDGVGEWSTTTYGMGRGKDLKLLKHIRFPNSLGLLYSAFTYYTGFKINSGEYKLMGLAPYGKPVYAQMIMEKLITVDEQGAVALNQHYFDYVGGLTMTNSRFDELFGGPPREPESLIRQKEMDIAASIQKVLNDILIVMARHVKEATGAKNLVLAGGVALNVVSTGILSREGIFDEIWIQPAAGDAGGALGACLWMWHQVLGKSRAVGKPDSMSGAFLGLEIPSYSEEDDAVLRRMGPWREWDLLSREKLMAYAETHGIPVDMKHKKGGSPYSMDANLLHISYEGRHLEDPAAEAEESMWRWTVSPEKAPNKAEYLDIEFRQGDPVALNGKKLKAHELLAKLNQLGGKHGIGRLDLVENRYVGMKSRGCYETPLQDRSVPEPL